MAHIGVLRALEAARIPISVVTGTSAGAIVGALYAAGKTADEIEGVARQLSFLKWFARDRTGMGLFSTDGICRILEAVLGQDVHIEDLKRSFACVAVDLESGQEVVFKSGPLADAVCASSAYPGLFAPVRAGDRYLLDGGICNPVPFDIARQLGADRVIACDLGAAGPFFSQSGKNLRHANVFWGVFYSVSHQQIFRIVERSFGIMAQQMRAHKMARFTPDLVIYPEVDHIGLLDFDLTSDCIAAGEKAARLLLPQIEELLVQPAKAARGLPKWAERVRLPLRLFAKR
jgi:NTE family protein